MPRWARQRDLNELEIFNALLDAHRNPVRGTDIDIFADHVDGFGVLIEVKSRLGRMRPIQEALQRIFKDRYHVVRTREQALEACGVKP